MTSTMPSPASATALTPTSSAAEPTTLPAILGTYKRQAPLFVRGEGVHMIDESGKRYLDFVAGIAVSSLGHADAGVMQAMQEAMATGLIHTSNLYRTAPGEALASWLVAHSFASSVFFSNSGAEANEGAFKFARRWAKSTGHQAKHEIIALRGSFHGRMPGTLAATDRPAYRLPFRPLMGGVTIVERNLEELRAVLDPETAAAVIVEPIQGEGGVRIVEPEFLRGLRELTRERNVLLILDEIQCGLGRTGSFFAYEQLGFEPDMLTIAKPLANGLPMGAILVNDTVARVMQPGDHGTTFGGGPLLAHVAHHVVQRLADPALLQHVRETGAWFGEQLQAIADRTGAVRAIRGTGLMWGMDVHEPAAAIIARAFDQGLLLVSAGEHTLRFLPPLVISREELAKGLAILEGAIKA
ncbi:MAG TPA: aspartate aminotransferase family protein [Gemmatimonas aurantiaca]|uniref:Acetylornithine/succinyldiaminopimelate aminotransferase n=2 Tax=Gemmatimonas aurantiaca TaxID=173480 RepID=C1A4P1_GEMAT|nr:acetylornithine/succinylornithine family transaminase [Gemmatimonas aurantiaca]BAH37201.1 acetylornithine/succinyldiaminopimelate aminotransferase [Gemmatimonas aurantiaca T-27]HCT55617.1 aspartate aminotransferase family protein [Gemmatimonas aurantiaca]